MSPSTGRGGNVMWHWSCTCGAYGSSTDAAANEIVIARHRVAGHVVEIWERGKRHLATTAAEERT